MAVGLSTGTFVSWAKGGDNYGLALTASQTDQTAWKQFASTTSAHVPYLQVTYTGNVTPVLDGQSPANNATVWTLQPTLVAAAHDPDKAPSPLTYSFALYDAATPTTVLASRPWGASTNVAAVHMSVRSARRQVGVAIERRPGRLRNFGLRIYYNQTSRRRRE